MIRHNNFLCLFLALSSFAIDHINKLIFFTVRFPTVGTNEFIISSFIIIIIIRSGIFLYFFFFNIFNFSDTIPFHTAKRFKNSEMKMRLCRAHEILTLRYDANANANLFNNIRWSRHCTAAMQSDAASLIQFWQQKK